MDVFSTTVRSRVMAAIRGTNTRPELLVRSLLHGMGLRFRLHVNSLPGRPDIVLRRHNTVVLVHGCFWHRHGCTRSSTPQQNGSYWAAKFDANKRRDRRNKNALVRLGWRVVVIWECELKEPQRLEKRLARLFPADTAQSSATKRIANNTGRSRATR